MSQISMIKLLKALFNKKSRLDYLRNFNILKDFTDYELYMFSQILNERKYKAGEFIYKEQYPLAVIYLVLEGTVEVQDNYHNSGKPTIIKKNQFLGIVDMYNQHRRQGEAKAIKNSVLLAVSYIDFQHFVKNHPSTGVKLMNRVCEALSHFIYKQHNSETE